jgi:hypothetical protein
LKTSAQPAAVPAARLWFRRGVLAEVAAVGAMILLGFARFPYLSGSPLLYVALAMVTLIMVGVPAGLVVLATRAISDAAALARRHSLSLALVLGVIWIAFTLVTHFLIPNGEQPLINAVLLWSVLAGTALVLLIGSLAVAWQTQQFTAGFATGLATGFLTGALALLTILLMLDLGMGFLVRNMNATELAGYSSSGWADRQAWYYWNEEFFGALGDFVLLVLSGAVLGALGAGIARFVAWQRNRISGQLP